MNQDYHITEINTNMMFEGLTSQDDLGTALRAHFLIEQALLRLCKNRFPNYSAFQHNKFSQHVKALRSLGYSSPLLQAADIVNKTRNDLAHNKKGKTKITLTEVDDIVGQINSVLPSKSLRSFVFRFDGTSKKIRNLPLAKQFFLAALTCAALIDTLRVGE